MERLFVNGRIYTMAREGEAAQALAVLGCRITAVGSNEEILKRPATEIVDLMGRAVLPGFIDTHLHLGMYADSLSTVDLGGAASVGEIIARLKAKADETPEGQWVRGVNFDHERLAEKRFPTRADLDAASTRHPIFISRCCLHAHVANSMALGLAGITAEAAPHLPHRMPVDAEGQPTGMLLEQASEPVYAAMGERAGDGEAAMRAVLQELSSYGITGVSTIEGEDAEQAVEFYRALAERGELTLRVTAAAYGMPPDGWQSGRGDSMVRYGFLKRLCDGSMGSRTAALRQPYADDSGTTGIANFEQGELDEIVERAHAAGVQVGLHAIGDRAMDMALAAIENAWARAPRPGARFRIIHASMVDAVQLERLARLPVVLDVQSKFLSTDIAWIDQRLGAERAQNVFNWKTMMRRGILLAGGSDLPVEPCNPMLGIAAAVTRQTLEGWPEGGWRPEECLTVYEAVSLFTRNAAYATFEENDKGTLEPGKLADFIVLDEDPFTVPANQLQHIAVEQTWLGGRPVFSRAGRIHK